MLGFQYLLIFCETNQSYMFRNYQMKPNEVIEKWLWNYPMHFAVSVIKILIQKVMIWTQNLKQTWIVY